MALLVKEASAEVKELKKLGDEIKKAISKTDVASSKNTELACIVAALTKKVATLENNIKNKNWRSPEAAYKVLSKKPTRSVSDAGSISDRTIHSTCT